MGLRQAQTDNCYGIDSWLHNVTLSLSKRFRLKIKVAAREGLRQAQTDNLVFNL